MNDGSRQRSGESGSRKGRNRRNAKRKQASARSRRNSARVERQELYLRWREESFDADTGRFIGEYEQFHDFYEVWSAHDHADDQEHEAPEIPTPLPTRRQSPLDDGRPRTETEVSVSDVVGTGGPAKLVAVSNLSEPKGSEVTPKGETSRTSFAGLLLGIFVRCLLIVAVATLVVVFWL